MKATMRTNGQSPWPFFQAGTSDMQGMMLTIPHMQAAGLRAMLAEQREMLSFAKRRCDEDLALADQLVEANDMKAVYEAVLHFYEGAAKDYVVEMSRALRLGSRVVGLANREWQHQAEELAKPPFSHVAA